MDNSNECSICGNNSFLNKEVKVPTNNGKKAKIKLCPEHLDRFNGISPKNHVPSCCGGIPLDANGHCPVCGDKL